MKLDPSLLSNSILNENIGLGLVIWIFLLISNELLPCVKEVKQNAKHKNNRMGNMAKIFSLIFCIIE